MADLLAGVAPMLAVAGTVPEDDGRWAYEMKWDGVRALIGLDGGRVQLASRLGNDITRRYPELHGITAAVPDGRTILDGEVVAFDEHGRPSFERLQSRMHSEGGSAPVAFLCFDILRLDGTSLLEATYDERRATLLELGVAGPHWQTPPAATASGEQALAAAKELGLEGIVAKRHDSPYRPGRRSTEWRKTRLNLDQEFVVGGWLPGEGRLEGRLGSLLVGFYDDGRLVYAGRVGSGLDERTRPQLEEMLHRRDGCPFDPRPTDRGMTRAVWVEPEVVVQVKYREFTRAGRLRQPSFLGLRDDKLAQDVGRAT